jgi:hypothetical protein
MSIIEKQYYRNVPNYYPNMYLDGYTDDEIWYAFHKKIREDCAARRNAAQEEESAQWVNEIKITSEVKIK